MKELLKKNKMTQAHLAKVTGIDPSRISNYVNRVSKLPKKHYLTFAEALKVNESELIKYLRK